MPVESPFSERVLGFVAGCSLSLMIEVSGKSVAIRILRLIGAVLFPVLCFLTLPAFLLCVCCVVAFPGGCLGRAGLYQLVLLLAEVGFKRNQTQ